MDDRTLLARTVEAARADRQTVRRDGELIRALPEGVSFRQGTTIVDDRGSIREMFDTRWDWHPDPIGFVYCFTIRPGVVKGWGLHHRHDDRYFLLKGAMKLVLYDVRPESSTCGQISEIVLSEENPGLINIPARVWHADFNFTERETVVVNFPTIHYDHAAPDKVRLPIDTPLIPYAFENARGG